MTTTKTSIKEEIEELRMEMYKAYERLEPYEEILRISQKLDILINEYQKKSRCLK